MVKATATFAMLRPILLNKAITLATRMLFYKAFIPPALVFGCESWALTKPLGSRLDAVQMAFLRRMTGASLLDHIPNDRILSRCGCLAVTDLISRQRMRWLGHLTRMDSARLPWQIFQGGLARGSRGPGRPRTFIQDGYRDDVARMSAKCC